MPIIYVSDSAGRLGTVNTANGAVNVIGTTGVTLTDLAFSPDGKLWGISFGNLYRINPANAQATLIGGLGVGGLNALTFDADGTAYAAAANTNRLHSINLVTGKATLIGANAAGSESSGDLAFHEGDLLWSTTNRQLADLNPESGAQQSAVTHGIVDLFGLVSTGIDQLYGISNTRLYRLNDDTGAATLQFDFAGKGLGKIFGAAFNGNFYNPETGTAVANTLSGTAKAEWFQALGGNDIVNAAGGNDTLEGGAGNDLLNGGAGNDVLYGFRSDGAPTGDLGDRLNGGAGNDTLFGQAGGDSLDGGTDADRLIGGAGSDTLRGGTGNDIFDYNAIGDSGVGAANRDVIVDFTGIGPAAGDRIDLADVFGGVLSFIGTGTFSAAGQVRVVAIGAATLVQVNTVGAGGAEMEIQVNDGAILPGQWVAGDFIL